MGKVRCKEHGDRQGPLCCQHVLTAGASTLAALRIDLLDDGSQMLDVVLCGECALQFDRADGEILPSRYIEDEQALPAIGPVCNVCLERRAGRFTPT